MFPQQQKPYVHQPYPAIVGYLPSGKAIVARNEAEHQQALIDFPESAQPPKPDLAIANVDLKSQVEALSADYDRIAKENQDLKEQLAARGVDIEELTAKLAAKNKKNAAASQE